MGSGPVNQVNKKCVKKWAAQISVVYNGSRTSTTVKGVSAPTESEILRALYDQYGKFSTPKFENLQIHNKYQYDEWE